MPPRVIAAKHHDRTTARRKIMQQLFSLRQIAPPRTQLPSQHRRAIRFHPLSPLESVNPSIVNLSVEQRENYAKRYTRHEVAEAVHTVTK